MVSAKAHPALYEQLGRWQEALAIYERTIAQKRQRRSDRHVLDSSSEQTGASSRTMARRNTAQPALHHRSLVRRRATLTATTTTPAPRCAAARDEDEREGAGEDDDAERVRVRLHRLFDRRSAIESRTDVQHETELDFGWGTGAQVWDEQWVAAEIGRLRCQQAVFDHTGCADRARQLWNALSRVSSASQKNAKQDLSERCENARASDGADCDTTNCLPSSAEAEADRQRQGWLADVAVLGARSSWVLGEWSDLRQYVAFPTHTHTTESRVLSLSLSSTSACPLSKERV